MSTIVGSGNATLKDVLIQYKDSIPTFFFSLLYNYLPDELLDYEVKKFVRIIMIVCGYIFFRKIIMNHQVLRAKKAQFETDGNKMSSENVDDLFEAEEDDETDVNAAINESGWGWGQKTKNDIMKKQEVLKSISQVNVNGDDDDDADIADLLED